MLLYMKELYICAYCSIDNVPKQCAELLYTYNLHNEENEVVPDSIHVGPYVPLSYFIIF